MNGFHRFQAALSAASVAASIALFASTATAADRGLPLVCEAVDEIVVVETVDADHCRVMFIRGDAVLATRLMVDEMLWTTAPDGSVRVIWQDYWTAERIVDAPRMSVWLMDEDPSQCGQNGPWWCQFRNMRDLKQP